MLLDSIVCAFLDESLSTAPLHATMVRAVKGVLLTCDPAVKQLILTLNERPPSSFESIGATAHGLRTPFIVQDLDDTHVLVAAECVEGLRAELDHELEKNTFALDTS